MLQLYQHLLPLSGNIVLTEFLLEKLVQTFQSMSNLSERKWELLYGASGSTVSLVTTKAERPPQRRAITKALVPRALSILK